MADSPDEPSAEYGLIAEWVSFPSDYSSVTFGINPKARFHDGTPITPEDVIFSFEGQKKAHPRTAFYYKNVVKAEKTGEHEVTFTFDVKGNRELPQIVGQLSVLPKQLLGGQGRERRAARPHQDRHWRSRSARALPRQGVRRRAAPSPTSASRTSGQRICRSPRASGTSTRSSSPTSSTATPAFEEFKSGKLDYWREKTRQPVGDGLRLRRRRRRAGSRRRRSRSSASRRCRRSSSICAASSSRIRACARPSNWPSTSRGPTRTCSTISTCASAATSTIPSSPRPACRKGASSRS